MASCGVPHGAAMITPHVLYTELMAVPFARCEV